MNKWRLIETAPKDGTWILLAGGNTQDNGDTKRSVVACWGGRSWDYSYEEDSWNVWRCSYADPTHWMPLPDAPEVEDESETNRGGRR